MSATTEKPKHFIRQIIEDDLKSGKHTKIVTRFPPEPNGYLHIGHAKSICLNFGIARDYAGLCYLRMDDTNPTKEESEYANAIIEDVKWLGFDWGDRLTHASDYYQTLYDCAVTLIKQGNAYVDSLKMEEIREHRGTLQQGGRESPYRNRTVAENLELFERMKNGQFPEGTHVLRAKIDMQSGNLNMRDPVLYRIRYVSHQRTGNEWCIYPMYDFAHPLSDAFENITHSLCTLEFQDHRPLYEWLITKLTTAPQPRQIEFARLNVSHTLTSKRKLRQLVEEGHVNGWADPRMPTLQGMRRRGYPPAALRQFCEIVGVTKSDSVIDMSVLEECVREELNEKAPRAMCVLRPLKISIENFPSDSPQQIGAACHPQHPEMGQRTLFFAREIFIEQDDFMEQPPADFHRLKLGGEVRLRNAYIVRCNEVIKDDRGQIVELKCTYDPDTLGKNPTNRKVKGVIHWVPKEQSICTEARLYDRLFTGPNPGATDNFIQLLNPHSLEILANARAEPALASAKSGDFFQFERQGYFVITDKTNEKIIVNRIVGLRDNWKLI